jgi:hypothetical protein
MSGWLYLKKHAIDGTASDTDKAYSAALGIGTQEATL